VAHDGDERCDHPRIKPIVLGQNPAGLGELPQLVSDEVTALITVWLEVRILPGCGDFL
jgi:hypothetical protein